MLSIPFNYLLCNSLIRPQPQQPQNALPVQKDPQKGPLLPAAPALAPVVLKVEKVWLWSLNELNIFQNNLVKHCHHRTKDRVSLDTSLTQ